ncbi:hypothetical protein MFUM_1010052 [Methylacidiphilum fumariolicum SolV]|uniref:Uncharacterized protein n=2 Tax=Candidatus Methylacidiphilum fumarolicum TaxID=591154 RepID=I0JVG3_METFB|nr:conserved protein of unknown function [Candidatus Methylacidiphilum fumarolicum]CCG91232.1 hypothetical protein MFUM_1010052 [Methylacidiphilum fumariolicum SolV]
MRRKYLAHHETTRVVVFPLDIRILNHLIRQYLFDRLKLGENLVFEDLNDICIHLKTKTRSWRKPHS